MSITTYPLNGIDYDASDAAGYTATRTSGVYSSEEDFAVTPAGGLTVTVSAGQGWVSPARFEGYSVIMRESETLTLTLADGQRPRIDRIVLRYDAASRKSTLQVLQGTPDTQPTAPAITRTKLIYDLCLAEVTRPAASLTITAADIRDTRANEDLCGVMRDGVTGIPTAQLEAEARAQLEGLKSSYTGGFLANEALVLSVNDWTQSGTGDYPWVCDAAYPVCNDALIPVATAATKSIRAVRTAELAPTCASLPSAVQFYAKHQPTEDITMQVMLFGANTSTSSGGSSGDSGGSSGSGGSGSGTVSEGSGISDTAKALLIELFEGAAYGSADLQNTLEALKAEWNVSGSVTPTIVPVQSVTLSKTSLNLTVGGSETLTVTILPSNATSKTVGWSASPSGIVNISDGRITALQEGSCIITAAVGGKSATCALTITASHTVPGESPVYELTEARQFLPANKEYIDTGVKLFEDISSKPTWTILIDANDFGRLKNLTVSPVMFHCGDGVGPYFSVAMWLNGALMLDLFGYETRLGWLGGSTSARVNMYLQVKGTQFRMGNDPANDAWQDIPKYTSNISSSLLLGAGKSDDGTEIKRYWDGTIRRFAVYNKELTNAQINTFLEGN